MTQPKTNKRVFIIALVLMCGSLAHNVSNHTFNTLRAVDLLSLIALGMLIGVVLVTGIQMLKNK